MRSGRKPYRLLEHTADIRLRISGRSFSDLLKNAVFALADQLVEADSVRTGLSKKIRLSPASPEDHLVRLLQECLFLFDARGFVARSFRKPQTKGRLWEATLTGERFAPERHHPKSEIKAVTYHGIKIRKRAGRWSADVVLDV